jgi:hypothetical protein
MGIMGMHQVIRAGLAQKPRQGCRSGREASERCLFGQRRTGSSQQELLTVQVAERSDQQQDLTLTAAYASAAINVQNAHES